MSWEDDFIFEIYSAVEIHDETCFDSDDIARGERTVKFSHISPKSYSWDGNRYSSTKFDLGKYRHFPDDCCAPEDFTEYSRRTSYLRNDKFTNRGIIVNPDDCSTIINNQNFQLTMELLLDRPGIWKVFSTLNAEVTVGSVLVANGFKKQLFNVGLVPKMDRGLVQLIASDVVKHSGVKHYYPKNYVLNLYLYRSGDGPNFSPPFIPIQPTTSQVYCPIVEEQIADIILPAGSNFDFNKNFYLHRLDQHRSGHNEALCVYMLCYSPLTSPVVMTFKVGGTAKLRTSNGEASQHGGIFFVPIEKVQQDKWAVITDPLDTFTFIRNQCRGFILRTTNHVLGTRTGSLDKDHKLIIESRDNGINTNSKVPYWELRVSCERPIAGKLPLVIKNLYSNACEVV